MKVFDLAQCKVRPNCYVDASGAFEAPQGHFLIGCSWRTDKEKCHGQTKYAASQVVDQGPVFIVPLAWGLSAAFVVLFLLCFLAALLFPTASLAHNWLGLFSTAPVGSVAQLVEGVIWNVVYAWIAAIIFGVVYNRLAPKT